MSYNYEDMPNQNFDNDADESKTGSYAWRIAQAKSRVRKFAGGSKQLPKGQSNAILNEDCPFCDLYRLCNDYKNFMKMGKRDYKVCRLRSDDTNAVWVDITPGDRAKVELGDKYGMLTVIEYGGYDVHRNPLWVVRCDCPLQTTKVIRGAHLLSGDTTSCGCQNGKRKDLTSGGDMSIYSVKESSKKTFRYTRGSARNPDGARHKFIPEHIDKTNTVVETLVRVRDSMDPYDPMKNYCGYKRQYCDECESKGIKAEIRFNKQGFKECTQCSLIF